MRNSIRGVVGLSVWCALSAAATPSHAGSFELREQSAKGMGAAFAGAAAGGAGLGSMYWNPATMTDFPGQTSDYSLTGILPYSHITPVAPTPTAGLGTTDNIAQSALLPSSYSAYQLTDKIWLGLAQNAPFGLVSQSSYPSASQFYGLTSKATSLDVNPNVAYKVTEWLSVAAGLQVEWFRTRLTSALSPLPGTGLGILAGHDVGFGYTLGATLKPMAGTEIGIGYRSRVREDLKGSFIVGAPVPAGFPLPSTIYGIKSSIMLPDELNIGIRQQVTDRLALLAGFEWTHWRLFNSFPVVATSPAAVAGATLTQLGFRYRDGYFGSLGAEYKWSDTLTVRAGLGYDRSPIDDVNRGVRIPDANRVWTSLGATYAINRKITVDASYAHLFVRNASVTIASTANPAFNPLVAAPFYGDVKAHIDLVSLGLTYRWDDPKVSDAPAPLVRKY